MHWKDGEKGLATECAGEGTKVKKRKSQTANPAESHDLAEDSIHDLKIPG
jgi:hypothetical protein